MSKTIQNLIIPGLWWDNEGDFDFVCSRMNIPNLARLLSKSTLYSANYNTSDYLYADLFMNKSNLASNIAAKLHLDLSGKYLLIEPVNFKLHSDQILISSSEVLSINTDESRAVIDLVNNHFAGELVIHYYTDELWLLSTTRDLTGLKTYSAIDICGKNIAKYMPHGENALYWHGVINEIQMLLYNSQINLARVNGDLFEISALWIWDIPYTDCAVALNLTIGSQISSGETNLLIKDLFHYNRYGDNYAYSNYLELLDKEVFSLLLHNNADKIRIIDPAHHAKLSLQINKCAWIKFWQNNTLSDIKGFN